MVSTVLVLYAAGSMSTGGACFAVAHRFADQRLGRLRSLAFSVLAGLCWPLVVLGAIEMTPMALFSAARAARLPRRVPDAWVREFGASTARP